MRPVTGGFSEAWADECELRQHASGLVCAAEQRPDALDVLRGDLTCAVKAAAPRLGGNDILLVPVFDMYGKTSYTLRMRVGFQCRAYPDQAQQAMLNRTFGCVRVVWNRTLAARCVRWRAHRKGTSYAQADRALTAMKHDPELAFLNEVAAVPLQQALRHQERAFAAFFAKRARYPRFKSRAGRQAATYTRAAFRMKDGELYLAKMAVPLRYTWTRPGIDPATLDPTSVTVARDPAGRWFVA